MTIKKYISYDKLQRYDDLIKAKIDEDTSNKLIEAKTYTDTQVANATPQIITNEQIDAICGNFVDGDGVVGGSGSGSGTTSNTIVVDQTYNPESENAQSGKAVAEALDLLLVEINNYLDTILNGNEAQIIRINEQLDIIVNGGEME